MPDFLMMPPSKRSRLRFAGATCLRALQRRLFRHFRQRSDYRHDCFFFLRRRHLRFFIAIFHAAMISLRCFLFFITVALHFAAAFHIAIYASFRHYFHRFSA